METVAFRRPESVLIVVHTSEREVLLLERVKPRGWWQSVTGSLEPGETPRQAAVRELAEETGLGPEGLVDLGLMQRFPILPPWQDRFAPGTRENLEHAFALALAGRGEIRLNPAEHLRHAWLPIAAALARATSHSDRAAIERACAGVADA